jgi:hypothetical protein
LTLDEATALFMGRLAGRVHFIWDAEAKAKIMRDPDQMPAMVRACLSYLRDGARQELLCQS